MLLQHVTPVPGRPSRPTRWAVWHHSSVNHPTPAVVPQRAVERLPRLALLLFCAAYLLPGLFGRDPWRNADLTAYGYMWGLARGRMDWWAPALGGLPPETALLPHWLGAWSVQGLGGWVDPALAARLPFVALLAVTLALIWYATYHLARTDAAQPVPFAFGGEADPVAYARTLADGALLATIATLGLLQLGHETTPELMQLSLVALFIWALAAAPTSRWRAPLAVLLALPALALSGAPSMAVAHGSIAWLISPRSRYAGMRRMGPWLAGSIVLATLLATLTHAWHWRIDLPSLPASVGGFLRLVLWFTWPVLPMAAWTVWRWRGHWTERHIAIPLGTVLVSLLSAAAMGGSDRALLLGVPGLAILAAFALPTLKRGASAAIDWFSVFFFSLTALAVWVIYSSMQLNLPPKPLQHLQRLAPGFEPSFSATSLAFALAGSAAWIWLVRWRTSRHRHPLWKSLVLPASGVALTWLLTMTLLLPVVDYARSTRPLVQQIARWVPADDCIQAPGLSPTHVAGLEVFGGYAVEATDPSPRRCGHLLVMTRMPNPAPTPAGWEEVTRMRRPVDAHEYFTLYRRVR